MRRKAVTTEMLKAELAESLLRLMAEKPFAEITVREIAEGAGVDRSTYYRHFTTREDVLEDYLDGVVSRYIDQVDRQAGRLESLCGMFTFFAGYRRELLLLHDNGQANLLLRVLARRGDDVTVWLADRVDALGLRNFLAEMKNDDGRCLAWTETT